MKAKRRPRIAPPVLEEEIIECDEDFGPEPGWTHEGTIEKSSGIQCQNEQTAHQSTTLYRDHPQGATAAAMAAKTGLPLWKCTVASGPMIYTALIHAESKSLARTEFAQVVSWMFNNNHEWGFLLSRPPANELLAHGLRIDARKLNKYLEVERVREKAR